MTRARRQGGLTLIEMMIALAILAFGILATMAGQVAAMHFSTNSREHTMAMKLAEDRMEEFFVATAADVKAIGTDTDSGNPIDPDPGDGNTMAFSRSWTIVEDTPEDDIITITVQVSWVNENGNTQIARIQSFKADL